MARRSIEARAGAKSDFGASIAERAYFKAEKRGFAPGHELEDWLAAEKEIAAQRTAPSAEPAGGRAAPTKKPTARRKSATAKKAE
jgi:hypothetical protein